MAHGLAAAATWVQLLADTEGAKNCGEQVVVDGAYALKARMLKSQIGDSH